MPNSNGSIYVDTTVTPNLGVSIEDVRTVLGLDSRDLGTLCGSENNNVNKWARYKPERNNAPRPISYSSRKANNFGLEVPFCNEYGANVMNFRVYNFIYGEEGEREDIWNYLKPRGDRSQAAQSPSTEFYRLSDFARIPSDTTDPNYGSSLTSTKGYNHNARIPFNVSMDESGCRNYYDSNKDLWVYEVNKAATSRLVFTFYNSIGEDLHLQDFVTIPSDSRNINDNTVTWRPIIQVFNDAVISNSQDRELREPWYNRHNAQYEIAGDAITSDTNSFWQVGIDLEDSNFENNQFFHVCIGIGLCNKSVSSWGSGTNALFLPPYIPEKVELFEFPFYCIIKPVSYNARTLWVDGVQFHVNSPMPAWVIATGTNGYYTIHSLMEGSTIGLTLKITKLRNQSLTFVKGTDTTTANQLKIKFEETISGTQGVTNGYMTPSVGANTSGQQSPWAEDYDGITIPVAKSAEEEDTDHAFTMYAIMDIGNIPVNGYGWYHLIGEQGSTTYNFGSFSIHKVEYTG